MLMFGRTITRRLTIQHRSIGLPIAIDRQKVMHAVGAERPTGGCHWVIQRSNIQNTVLVIPRLLEHVHLALGGIDPDLPVVRTRGADGISRHDVVNHTTSAFRDTAVQAGRAVGVEGLATQVEMVRGNLCKGATKRVPGYRNLRCGPTHPTSIIVRIGQCATRKFNSLVRLPICPACNHGAIC